MKTVKKSLYENENIQKWREEWELANLSRQKVKKVYLYLFIVNLIIVVSKSFFYKDLPDLNNLIIKS